ncbi:MAG TPA: GMC family oxidoreductase N-terminal domain-containing protein [Streptosporangiaceae bacterium]
MYDYIVVGAGSAGCVLAARLTEDPETKVLLLEAGPPDDAPELHIPAAVSSLFKGPYDWNYTTKPRHEVADRSVYWPRGRTLGGSSSTNAMIYIRGNRHDYDTWRDKYGCTGWGHEDVLPYFLRAEDQQRGESECHGTGGPLRVEDLRFKHPLARAWLDAAQAYGLPANDDFNGAEQDGVGFYQVTQRRGRRWSTADGYLRPALDRPNLTVRTDALVTNVEIDGGRAVGVRFLSGGGEERATADREVILSGGAVASPQLLMLSGIGPADHLRELGIDVVVDSPEVGRGLQDHPVVAAMWHAPSTKGIWEGINTRNLLLWQSFGRGPFASNVAEAGGFVRTVDGLPAPDLQYHVLASPYIDQGLADPSRRLFTVLVTAVAVGSRGRITLRSADPRWKPVIDAGYLTDEADLEVLVAGVRQAREISYAGKLAKLTAGEYAPGEQVDSDDALRAWVRRDVVTLYHPTSTCAMGGDGLGVCDPELRVRGVEGLRVVDASVMPAVPRGNTNAPTIAIAERAADLIRGRAPLANAVAGAAG